MEIIVAIISKIVEYTVDLVASEVSYVFFLNKNFRKLKKEIEMLNDRRESVQDKIFIAKNNAQDINLVVRKWLSDVDEIIRKSEEIILVNEGRQGGSCTNLVQLHKLSKQARKMADEVIQLKEKGSFDEVSSPGFLINQSLQPKIVDFLDFESRKLTMNQIIDALKENHVNRIGVYGMGGVGKTMLVNEILRKLMEEKAFDKMVKSTISETPDLKNIQGQFADVLGLKFEQETIEGRALKLRKRLMNDKYILLVLDDVWKYIDLETIGIPNVLDHPGCKILFTSRDKHLLSNEMKADKTFEIKLLEKEESWNLFKTTAGEIVEDMQPIADQIVMECAHLPITIIIVAKALRNKPSSHWYDALDQLKEHVVVNNIRGMDEGVYSSLKLSYDYLRREEAKLLFLLCSMFPEDFRISVEDLQVYAMAMGFLHGVDTIAKARRRITTLVDDLISSSLLLQDEFDDNYIKMHDVVRDVAILISSKNNKIRTLSYVKTRSKEWDEEKLSDNYTAVYVEIQDSHNPIPRLQIPNIQLLRIHAPYLEICEEKETFFEKMKELKCLELRRVEISSFPSSLNSFANVRLLHLFYCELGNIDTIGDLKNLEILSFQGSNIVRIPTTISQLTQLKVLDLSWCQQLNIIPPNILSRLTKLEELYLGDFNGWEREEWYEGRKNASLSELRNLPRLYALTLWIQDEKIIPKQLFSREMNLENFKITIGTKNIHGIKEISKFLFLNIESECCSDDWIKSLLKRSEGLCLVGSISTKTLQSKFDVNVSSHLKHFQLYDNLEIKHFIHKEAKPLRKILFNLESLELRNAQNLESIIHGYNRETSFHKLRRINVRNCGELKNLFFNCTLNDIWNLETIDIYGDAKMMEVLFVVEHESNQFEFHHLKSLSLYGNFPQLKIFCCNIGTPETSTNCNGGSFFSDQVSLPNLEQLRVEGAHNLKRICHNISIPNSFSKLKEVYIDSCNNLEKVFPSNIMSMLTGLKTLCIENCNLLQGIFEVQDLNVEESSVVFIKKLRILRLCNLPNLEYVWNKDHYELLLIFEDIRHFCIDGCPKLKRSSLVHKQPKSLQIDFGELKEVLEKAKTTQMQDSSRWFSNLNSLTLSGSYNHKLTLLPREVVKILHNLTTFDVRSTFIEEIFTTEGLIDVEQYQNATSMALESLFLSDMPKLRHIWKLNSQNNNILSFQNLSSLNISNCSKLNIILPSPMSFKKLGHLDVDGCHQLNHLLDSSVARALVQLYYLRVRRCKRMITVIGGGDESEGNDEIVFNNLRRVTLKQCSKLENFYSSKCIIRFPCLEYVSVKDCPEMKVFSLGIVATPVLPTKSIEFSISFSWPRNLKVNSEEFFVKDINFIFREFWEENSDTTNIQNLFTEEDLEANIE